MDRPDTSPSSRRDFFALACSIAAAGVPTVATAAADDDARFLEWERLYWAAYNYANAGNLDEDEVERRCDEYIRCERLIYRTPAAGLTGLRVKAAIALHNMEQFMIGEDREQEAVRTILDTLRRLA